MAEQAGVAVSTASAILRGEPTCRATEQTRQRVFEAARAVNYRPNKLAKGLRAQSLSVVGVVFRSFEVPPVTIAKFADLEKAAAAHGYRLWFGAHAAEPARQREYVLEMVDHRVAGMILASEWDSADLINELIQLGVPTVTMENAYPTPTASMVNVDRAHGAYLAVKHLWTDVGCRKLAFLMPPIDWGQGLLKLQGCERALHEVGSDFGSHLVFDGPLRHKGEREEELAQRMIDWLLDQRREFDGVVTYSDLAAFIAAQRLQESGRRIPEDVAVTGFDDLPLARYNRPALTTVRQPLEVGHYAWQLLHEQIQGERPLDAPPKQMWLKPQLIVRGSTVAGAGNRTVAPSATAPRTEDTAD
ncbi:MAG: LacI family DNA-binding transcriptional regulator [Phycisphaeraceae bacterium]